MSMNGMRVVLVALAALTVGSAPVDAQWARGEVGWCDDEGRRSDQDRHCMVLEADFADPGRLVVDGGMNGGVQVEGWSGDRVRVRAKVWANARSASRAQEIAEAVRVELRSGELSADGPRTERREHWGVSWEVMVPRDTDLRIETHNGGISVTDVRGAIDFDALNGGVHLSGVAGDVRGHTTNGGLTVELDGSRWDGDGLDAETTNGGVTIRVPANYSARLETGTVNGGIDLDFPVMVQGRVGRRLSTTLGEGGATVRAVTTNGGVRVVRTGNAIR